MSARDPIPFERSELLRFLTAGSVDDGKSTLIGRLLHDSKAILEDQLSAIARTSERRGLSAPDLSLLTDGLIAEREQGITIDVAYRYFSTGQRKFIIADAPGHEQYTRNMVTAASKADLAIVLIDARKGVLTQSRRHACIAHLMGVPQIVVAVNKMDLVDYNQAVFDDIRQEFGAFAQRIGIVDVAYVPISALHGHMVVERGERLPWFRGVPLLSLLQSANPTDSIASGPLRFPVQWVCRPGTSEHHDFRGYAGRIESGEIRVGDAVAVLPANQTTRIAAIHTHDGELERAFAPQSVMLLLEDYIDIGRGDMIVAASAQPGIASEFEADLCWLSEQPLELGRKYLLKHGTRTVKAMFPDLRHRLDINTLNRETGVRTLNVNDIGRAQVKTQSALVFDPYQENRATGAFIVIDEATNNTVAAGMIAERRVSKSRWGRKPRAQK
jgi:sulfate adenylyltransferase subunit 1